MSLSPRTPLGRLGRTAALLLVGCGLLACRTTTTRQPPAAVGVLQVAAPRQAFEVVDSAGTRVGVLIRFVGSPTSRSHYMVRNIWQQDVGLIDHLGRAYRYVPHRPEPLWVGTGTVLEGAEEVLGVSECLLFELPFDPEHPTDLADAPRGDAGAGSDPGSVAHASHGIGDS